MMILPPRRALLAGAMSLICSAASAATHTYSYTLIAAPGAQQTNPIAINGAGTVLGYWFDSNYASHGFIYQNGKLTSFDVPKATSTTPTGINDKGDIVGAYDDANFNAHGFIYTAKGKFRTVDLPGSPYNALSGINADGVAVGVGLDSSSNLEIFTYKNGKFTTVVDGNSPVPVAINASGSIAGTFEAPHTDETAFVYQAGKLTNIPIKNVYFAQSYAINKKNVVVGQVANTQRQEFGFRYKDGKVKLFGPPGSTDCFFTGINDHDAIAGANFDSNGNSTGGFVFDQGDFSTLTIAGMTGVGATAINNAGQVIGDYVDGGGPKTFLATPTN